MKKKIFSRKSASLLLAAVLMAGTLGGCNAGTKAPDQPEAETTDKTETTEGNTVPLVIGREKFSEKFNIFFGESEYDMDIANLTTPSLVDVDRAGGPLLNGKTGETVNFNGTDYNYTGIADTTITKNTDTTVYNFKLREDVTFSDGKPLTADDLIFSLYVFADSAYDGMSTFNTMDIVGLKNYRSNSSIADTITPEEVSAYISKMPESLALAINEKVIAPVLLGEQAWCTENFEANGAASAEEFFVVCYSKDESYKAEGKDYDTIVKEITEMYGADVQTLGSNYAGDPTYFDAKVQELAAAGLVEELAAAGKGEEVPNIEGIKKLGDYEVEVTTNGFDATAIYQFNMGIAPLHYYGDETQYNYENNQFGFTRGDLSAIKEKGAVPMGAGPYKFVKFENKVIYMEANETYYKGAPKIKNLQYKETYRNDMIPGIQQGTIDLTDPDGSKENFEQIMGINSNGELDGDKLITDRVDNRGYGYIGFNAATVNVGGEPASEQSRNLRKAIATVMAAYRDVTIDSYYGEAASVIEYPISNTSWAAPQKSDAGYQVAYSTDVDGNPLYTEGMSLEEKYAKALEASLGFFQAAGYTVTDGKLTAAPAGAKLTYEIVIPADGVGNHPSFAIMTDAKAALATIGFTLDINDPSDPNILWDKLNAGTHEMWTAAWQASFDPDMYQTYHSESVGGYYHISDAELDAYIMEARGNEDQGFRKSIYKECLDIILDWGVELPVYQRQNCIAYSTERINADTMTPAITTNYNWWREIENIEMKAN